MHFHLPKPLHGWRAFAGEVGIIVVGVLIALAAEQVVSSLTWQADVRDFRAALDTEVRFDLAASNFRVGQTACLERRLSDLHEWSAAQRAGKAVPLVREIGYPIRVSPGTSVWNSRGAGVTAFAALGDNQRAKDWIQRALLLDPDNNIMRYNLACALTTDLTSGIEQSNCLNHISGPPWG